MVNFHGIKTNDGQDSWVFQISSDDLENGDTITLSGTDNIAASGGNPGNEVAVFTGTYDDTTYYVINYASESTWYNFNLSTSSGGSEVTFSTPISGGDAGTKNMDVGSGPTYTKGGGGGSNSLCIKNSGKIKVSGGGKFTIK